MRSFVLWSPALTGESNAVQRKDFICISTIASSSIIHVHYIASVAIVVAFKVLFVDVEVRPFVVSWWTSFWSVADSLYPSLDLQSDTFLSLGYRLGLLQVLSYDHPEPLHLDRTVLAARLSASGNLNAAGLFFIFVKYILIILNPCNAMPFDNCTALFRSAHILAKFSRASSLRL